MVLRGRLHVESRCRRGSMSKTRSRAGVLLAFFVSACPRNGIGVEFEYLLSCPLDSLREIATIRPMMTRMHVTNSVPFDPAPHTTQIPGLLETLNGGLAPRTQPKMPGRKPRQHQPNDPANHTQHDYVDRRVFLEILVRREQVVPHPIAAASKTDPTEDTGVDEEKHEGLVVMQS